ncbi:sensor histidine kinase [Streptomyces sp. C36]|uniref:sensor histidine kinase n=1 Tax=Streptomyces sp. C36 TaxID=3237122 RepID=UPI0034C6DC24
MGHRDVGPAVIAAGCGGAGAVGAYGARVAPYGVVPAVAAVALLVWCLCRWRRARGRLALPVALVGVVSLATTLAGVPPTVSGGAWPRLVETATLLVLLVVVARWAPLRHAVAAGAVAGTAVAVWTLPLLTHPSVLVMAGAVAFWWLPVCGAAVVGGYPRLMEYRRDRLVAETRRSQQLELARDLHDFVAHDVSGIVAQAQAARFVAAADPGQAVPALERIEKAGLNALASMDRMVRMLHATDGADGTGGARGAGTGDDAVEPLPGVDQLPGLVERFTAAGPGEARLSMAPEAAGDLSRDTGSTAYRVVVEALTNVRRHAPGTPRVAVTLGRVRGADGTPRVELRVADDGGGGPGTRTRAAARREREGLGGRGLSGLRERVRSTGGTLDYGPYEDGWQVVALLPVATAVTMERAVEHTVERAS